MNAGRPVRPPRRHRTPRLLLPVTLSWVFYLPDPTRRRPGWAGGRASPPCAPTWTPFSPGPTLRPHLLPTGTISAITPLPPRARPGRVPHLGSASPLPTPRGWASWGSSFVAFYEESRTPPRSLPHPPRGSPSALSPSGPGTTVAGPTQDQGAWASPLSQLLGRGDGASPHHTCGCSHIPLSIPGKIKRQNCIRAGCSLQKEPPLPRVWKPGVCVGWVGERRGGGGVGVGRQGAGEWREGRPGATLSVWGGLGSLGQLGKGDWPPGGRRRT